MCPRETGSADDGDRDRNPIDDSFGDTPDKKPLDEVLAVTPDDDVVDLVVGDVRRDFPRRSALFDHCRELDVELVGEFLGLALVGIVYGLSEFDAQRRDIDPKTTQEPRDVAPGDD